MKHFILLTAILCVFRIGWASAQPTTLATPLVDGVHKGMKEGGSCPPPPPPPSGGGQ